MPKHAERSPKTGASAVATAPRPSEDRSSRRWISERIEQLDPIQDYAEIMKLNTSFYLNEPAVDWAFAQSMPRFNMGPSGAAIFRGGQGKLIESPERRLYDTDDHFLVWIEYGPESPQVKRSVDIINALHRRWSKEYPAEFDDLDLWTYVLAWEICGTPTLFTEKLGFPEPSEKVKTASVIFGKKLAELFVYIDGRPLSEAIPPMDTYEEWVAFLHKYESQHWTYEPDTAKCLAQVIDIYTSRSKLPKPLATAVVTEFWHDGMFKSCDVKKPSRLMGWAARAYMKFGLTMAKIMPDPKESLTEKMRRESAATGTPLRPILKATQVTDEAAPSRCPMGFGGGESVPAQSAGAGEPSGV